MFKFITNQKIGSPYIYKMKYKKYKNGLSL